MAFWASACLGSDRVICKIGTNGIMMNLRFWILRQLLVPGQNIFLLEWPATQSLDIFGEIGVAFIAIGG